MLVESARGVSTEFVERKPSQDGCLRLGYDDGGHPWKSLTGLRKSSECRLPTFTARTMILLK